MSWLLIILIAYFLIALTNLGDKYLLVGAPNPKDYSFFVGMLGIVVLLVMPFVGFALPFFNQLILALIAVAVFILAVFTLYNALEYFEASRVIPALGGFIPLFTLGLIYLSSGKIPDPQQVIALFLLIFGSIFITLEKKKNISFKSLFISILAAFLFSLTFFLSKHVYLNQPFWSGFMLMRVGGFLTALCFLFSKDLREEIFKKKYNFNKKTGSIFILNQIMGGVAFILQNWAIALAPLVYVAFINVLQGVQYVFLLIFSVFLSLKFPQILKEEISKGILVQKIIAIIVIGGGLALLVI